MTCITPPELSETQLLAVLNGEVDAEVASHLERCSYCRERSRQLSHLHHRLKSRLHRLDCPAPSELGEFHLRLLAPARALVVAQHVRECPHCSLEVSQLKEYLGELDEPSAEVGLAGQVRILFARLIGDGLEGSSRPLTALRGARKGPILLEAEGLVITLDVQPAAEGSVSIMGQLAADDQDQWTAARVELQQAGAPPAITVLDDLGAFRYETAGTGSSQLKIISSNGLIVQTPDIEISV